MLEEVVQPYRTEVLGFRASMKEPAYLAINPMGKVPAIRHGDAIVTEGAAICAYLADAFPLAGLAPPTGDLPRASYYRGLFFAAGPIEAAVTDKALGFSIPPGREVMAGYGCYEDALNALESAVSGRKHIVSDRFTAADVYVGSQIGSGLTFGIEKRAAFETYWGDLEDISQKDILTKVAEKAGLDGEALLARSEAPEIKEKLRLNTEEVIARGGFGSPTMFVNGDDMYFGNDRLPLVEAALTNGRAG